MCRLCGQMMSATRDERCRINGLSMRFHQVVGQYTDWNMYNFYAEVISDAYYVIVPAAKNAAII